ncbi:MAG: hypothetical protein WC558_16725 [Patulibacter sp.]
MPVARGAAPGSRRRASLATTALVLLAIAAVPAVATESADAASSKSSKRCPTVGRTLAVERFDTKVTSRVWRVNGRTYGCTFVRSRPRTRFLTRATPGLVRLDDDTVAWTTTRVVNGVTSNRVWAYDLTSGRYFVRSAAAVPRRSAGDVPREGTVDQLQVTSAFFVAWVANGTTVVVGADDPGNLDLLGADGATTPLYLDRGFAVAGSYDPQPDLAKQLSDSLKVEYVPGDHGDSDDCASSYLVAFTWSTAPGQTFEARMGGTRITPVSCGG